MIRVQLRGTEEVVRNLRRLAATAPRAAASALYTEAESIMARSKAMAPVDKGQLRASGFVQPPAVNGTIGSVTLGYNAHYAIYVHELHKTKSKFLERPMRDAQNGMLERLARRMAEWLEREGSR